MSNNDRKYLCYKFTVYPFKTDPFLRGSSLNNKEISKALGGTEVQLWYKNDIDAQKYYFKLLNEVSSRSSIETTYSDILPEGVVLSEAPAYHPEEEDKLWFIPHLIVLFIILLVIVVKY